MRRVVTSFDVARKAGVSRTTVSAVLNDSPGFTFSNETRKRVREVARELCYVPNHAGRALVSARTHNLGFFLNHSQVNNPLVLSFLSGYTQAIAERAYHLVVDFLDDDSDDAYYQRMVARGIEGLLVFDNRPEDKRIQLLIDSDIPLVFIGSFPDDHIWSADVDEVRAAYDAVRHLIELGRRTIGCITNSIRDYFMAQERLAGYRRAIDEAGIPFRDELVAEGDFAPRSGYDATRSLIGSYGGEIDALFVMNDTIGIGALRALGDEGVRVPDDVAVIGFDDLDLSTYLSPSLSSVSSSPVEIGRTAGRMLVDRVEGDTDTTRREIIPHRLVLRESTEGAHRDR